MVLEKYLSQIAVKEIFPEGQKKIGSSSAVVIGMGGTGSTIAELLVRMGIKSITIVDHDTIEESNLNRQSLYKESDIGLKKVDVAKEELAQINEDVTVESLDEKLSFLNSEDILRRGDITMDGTDNYSARSVINATSFALKKPWIFSAVEGTYGYVKPVIPGTTSCLSCFGYPDKGEGVSCTVQGVIPSVVKTISSIAVTMAIKVLLKGSSSGDLIYFDAWRPSMETMQIPRNEQCKVCGHTKE